MRLQGKISLITGGASGIGEATARLFAREGAAVAVADIDRERGPRVVEEITAQGGRALFLEGDVTREEAAAALVAQTLEVFRRLDVLFNNAGIGHVATLHETDPADWQRVMTVNVTGIYLMSRAALPHMIEQQRGTIINVSSAIAFTGLAKRAVYAASKGAVLALTRSMAVDYAPYNIRVNAICPGTIYTPFVENYLRKSYADPTEALEGIKRRQLTGALGRPEDVAHAALYLASDEAAFMTGAAFVIDGGLTAGKL